MPVELTQEEKDLIASIINSLGLPTLVSFKIKDAQDNVLSVDGSDEFFAATDVLNLYSVYAKAYIELYRQNATLQARVTELEEILGVGRPTFRKTPFRPILVNEVL